MQGPQNILDHIHELARVLHGAMTSDSGCQASKELIDVLRHASAVTCTPVTELCVVTVTTHSSVTGEHVSLDLFMLC